MRENYLVEHTVGSIIRSAIRIYIRYFGTVFLIYVLPVLPVALIQQEAQLSENTLFFLLAMLLTFVVSFFAYGATTVAVSDVCVGNAPSVKRSYNRILGRTALLLLTTNLLQILALAIGMMLLVVPGLVLMFWLILTPSVVVLEGRSGVAALKRSKQLGDGAHWRSVGLLLLLMIISFVIVVIGGVIGLLVGLAGLNPFETWIFRVLIGILQVGVFVPINFIAWVLVYYDRRVRKEGYDARALAEDLAR